MRITQPAISKAIVGLEKRLADAFDAQPYPRQAAPILFSLTPSSEAPMIVRYLRAAVAVVGILCLLALQVRAQTATHEEATDISLQSVAIGDRGTEFLLRFNRPISHTRSQLTLFRDGRIVETIHFRLESAPNVLFARIRTPAPGDYVIRWSVCPEGSEDRYDGEIPLTVRPVSASDRTP
jgi:hypothetical protein